MLLGIVITPIFILKEIFNFLKINNIYRFNAYIVNKLENTLKKTYVINERKRKLEAILFTSDGKKAKYKPKKANNSVKSVVIAIIAVYLILQIIGVIVLRNRTKIPSNLPKVPVRSTTVDTNN